MIFVTLWRMIKFGLHNFWRNIWLSLITVLIVSLNLFLMTSIVGINLVGQHTLETVKSKVNFSVFFVSTISDERFNGIANTIKSRTDVTSVRLVSREQHLADLQKSRGSLVNDVVNALGENPLGPGLVISGKTLDDYPAIAAALKDKQYATVIENVGNDVADNKLAIEHLSNIVRRIQTATYWLTGLFALIAILMVFNAIRVSIYTQREEIGIMKLVGASDTFVRGPFLVTSLMYGIIAGVFTVGILMLLFLTPSANGLLSYLGFEQQAFTAIQSQLPGIIGYETLAGCLLAGVSSIFAIGRYLRV